MRGALSEALKRTRWSEETKSCYKQTCDLNNGSDLLLSDSDPGKEACHCHTSNFQKSAAISG